MAPLFPLHLALALVLLAATAVLSDHSPAHSPALPPAADASTPTPSPSPTFFSPPAPPPSDLPPIPPPPAASPDKTPTPAPVGDISHENHPNAGDLKSEPTPPTGEGMNGGQKAGVAIGVIAAACIVGIGAFVYKKRQQNIQRANYGYAAGIELL